MESASKFMCVLAYSSLWLTGSGFVLWLCLRSRFRLSAGTRAMASILIVVQGWIWIGIPVQLDIPVPLGTAWIMPQPASIPLQQAAGSEAGKPSTLNSRLLFTTSAMPDLMLLTGAVVAAIWMSGIVVILWRSICACVALSRMVHALPRAPMEWQDELSVLCHKQSHSPLVLKVSSVASPMLVQTWSSACIVVPTWLWKSCTAEQRTSILLHELAHYRRGDVWRQLAMRLLVLPHWFNPVAWWAARQLEAASEAACDEVACGGEERQAISYAKALLVLSETIRNKRLNTHYAPALAISGSSLTERIRHILHPGPHQESRTSRFIILSAMIVLAGLATIRLQAAGQSRPAEKKPIEKIPAESQAAQHLPAKPPAASLITNGGFEEVREKSNDPTAWLPTRVPRTVGHFLLVPSSVPHGGKRSVAVEIGDNHPDLPVHYNWTTEAQGWQAGETYELSGWVKVENAQRSPFLLAQCWSSDGKRIIGGRTTQGTFPITGTTDWTWVSTRFQVPEGTSAVRIRAGLTSQGNPGAKAWFDDITLVPVVD